MRVRVISDDIKVVPTNIRRCMECMEMREIPVGEYEICMECYFALCDKANRDVA